MLDAVKVLLSFIKAIDFTSIIMAILKSALPGWGWFVSIFARPVVQEVQNAGDKEIGAVINQIDVKQGVDQVHQQHDQTKLEQALGSPNAGQPAEYRDGVQERPDKH